MWFVFGLITLISFSVYFGIKRFEASWQGERSVNQGQPFSYQFVRNKGKTQKFMVGIDAPREFDFSFKRESGWDRFFKWLGLSVEHEVGTLEFDKLVYVVSNDSHFLDKVTAIPNVVEAVTELFKLNHYGCQVTEVRCANGRLWAIFRVGGESRDEKDLPVLPLIFPRAAELLHEVSLALKLNLPIDRGTRRDPFILRAIFILAISTGLAVNGVTHVLRLMMLGDAFTVDTAQLWWYSAYVAAILLVFLIALAIYLLGRSARAHLVLIELVLIGSLGAVMTAFAEIRDLNMEMDTSFVASYETSILDKTISRSRKGGTRYYVRVADWNGESDSHKFQVSRDFYDHVSYGERLRINQRAGYLGLRWVESFHRLSAN